jgi:mRNA interferase RelE/StbE
MAEYRVFLRRSAANELHNLPPKDLKRVVDRIKQLVLDPRPLGSEKLAGLERYRIRQGDYRIVYSVQDDEHTIWIVRIGHRRDIYEKLTRD